MHQILIYFQRINMCIKWQISVVISLFLIQVVASPVWAADFYLSNGRLIESSRQAELIKMVRQDCGSCHGMTLKGGLGPALLPNTLDAISLESLKAVILFGRSERAMPPWQKFITEDEAAWIAINLKKGFPNEN